MRTYTYQYNPLGTVFEQLRWVVIHQIYSETETETLSSNVHDVKLMTPSSSSSRHLQIKPVHKSPVCLAGTVSILISIIPFICTPARPNPLARNDESSSF